MRPSSWPQPLMVPSTGDAPTLALAAATLLASVYPQAVTPDEAEKLGQDAVSAVFSLWGEIQQRIANPPVAQAQPPDGPPP